jgi:transposase
VENQGMGEQFSTKTLDHLGIVAGICESIDLIGQIDARVPDTGRKVSVGQAVQAMVLNGLGFVGRALYLMPEFFANKPVDLLVGEGLVAEDLNSDSLGKALDRLYEAGITELFAAVSAHALAVYDIPVQFAHADTTAFSLQGEYAVSTDADESEPQLIRITYGHSKDHRPDLKQAILSLITSGSSRVPLYLQALSGNTSDKRSLPSLVKAYRDQLSAETEMPIFVADAALYSADNLAELSRVKWVTRVPATLNAAKALLAATDKSQMTASDREGYFHYETQSDYGDIPQRWLVVLYEPRREAEQQRLGKQRRREREKLDKQVKKLQKQYFNCEADAQQALAAFDTQWAFHRITGDVQAQTHYTQPGRPTPDSPTRTMWYIQAQVSLDEAALQDQQQPLGKYLIATNELDTKRLPTEALLGLYKAQNTSVERGFRFLKDPMFFAHSLFLKKASRIMALLMVMGLSLLIYALAEHHLRRQLQTYDQAIPDQKGKLTQRPTLRRVFQMFEGIHILTIAIGDVRRRMLTNVTDLHLQIATLLGEPVRKFYIFEEYPL